MASMTVKHLLDGIKEILQDTSDDETQREWSESYLVDCYNIEARKISSKFPDACSVTEAIKLAEGIKQVIPAKGNALITVLMNMGTDGETHGEAINKTELSIISLFNRNWATDSEDDIIINFMPDPADPAIFYTYPPADGTTYVLAEFSTVPDQVVYDDDGDWELELIGIKEKYIGQLESRIIARCYKKDSDLPGNLQRETQSEAEAAQESQGA